MMGLAPNYGRERHQLPLKRLYALFVKAAARGQLPLQFRGGFLIPLFKSKGSHSDPGNFRGILLQDTMAKAFAKCWRTRLVDRFARLAAPLQFGCLKGKGVCEAHLPLRLHLHIGASYRMATAVIFVDIRAPYYTVVKEFFFDSAPEDGMHALRGLYLAAWISPMLHWMTSCLPLLRRTSSMQQMFHKCCGSWFRARSPLLGFRFQDQTRSVPQRQEQGRAIPWQTFCLPTWWATYSAKLTWCTIGKVSWHLGKTTRQALRGQMTRASC